MEPLGTGSILSVGAAVSIITALFFWALRVSATVAGLAAVFLGFLTVVAMSVARRSL